LGGGPVANLFGQIRTQTRQTLDHRMVVMMMAALRAQIHQTLSISMPFCRRFYPKHFITIMY
jgi:hypothetical protein